MPYDVAELVMNKLKLKESMGSYHYIDANGWWTSVGSTYSNNIKEFNNIFGKDSCDLILIAQNVVRDNNSKMVYYSLDGKNWKSARKGSGGEGDLVLKLIQSKTKGGDEVFISSKPGGKGNVVEYERISDAGFIIKKVNGKSISDPGWEVAENLNMQIMDSHYNSVKNIVDPDNWERLTAEQKVDMIYSHYHHPGRYCTAAKNYGLNKRLPDDKLNFETDTTTFKTRIIPKVPVNNKSRKR